ncbi:hypothetical protein MNB_SUP05-SYMBIONT-5-1195 [hydrothermal vent metagenome]|uniref:Uncharacterized protein n=1 Tax=hydrothermal vent metagenome TaxID=652676 RepID=A0A1W1E162_9ZZZZ
MVKSSVFSVLPLAKAKTGNNNGKNAKILVNFIGFSLENQPIQAI